MISENRTIFGAIHATSCGYDPVGNLGQIVYPIDDLAENIHPARRDTLMLNESLTSK